MNEIELGSVNESMTRESLRIVLSERIGKTTIMFLCGLCGKSESSLDSLFSFISDGDDRVGYNALWVFTHFNKLEILRLSRKRDELIDIVLREKHTGKRRLLLTILEKLPIDRENVRGDYLDYCLSGINSTEPYGVRSLCMKQAFVHCRLFPEMMPEFLAELEMVEFGPVSPGLIATKRNIMRHLVNCE